MNVFIDTERLRDPHSGLGQFCRHLGDALVRRQPTAANLTFLVPPGQTGAFGREVFYRETTWWRRWLSPGGFDLWHCTHQDSAYLPPAGTQLILTIHDLNFLERADYSEAKKARKLAQLQKKVARAAAITTISEYTASVVRQHLRLPDVPLKVIYNGNPMGSGQGPLAGEQVPETLPPYGLTGQAPYFLSVGVIHPKKNLHTLLPMLEAFPDYRLVLAGPDGHDYARHLRQQAESLGIADRLLMPGAVDEPTKRWLYENCRAFLFPSLSEGFGLPVVEAMSLGKPVFLSRLTSLPEVGGKEAYYFNSFEPESMAETIFDGLQDFAANPFRASRLQRWAAQFSWERAGEEYWTLFQELRIKS
ncbi:glycosyltransferase family 4 protein [Tellurirhabdus rosea]|uniref:glycosyltransferase family 4 protein n=1 Tax=Tellurirhabdus rosea TaxID=2674997 RepID=UPI002252A09B|nr:glycosyltransferase family 1 protein [Tellurirhabdus rosea]